MSARYGKKKARICEPVEAPLATYAAIVRAYKTKHQISATEEIAFYSNRNSLSEVIQLSATARGGDGNKHSHQWRIPNSVLQRFASSLLKIQSEIKKAADFHSLWELVRREGMGIKGIGELAIYDTAHRIGAFVGIEPAFVYLHAGTRAGAKALNLSVEGPYLKLGCIPSSLRHLKPYEIEDCLCIYKAALASMR